MAIISAFIKVLPPDPLHHDVPLVDKSGRPTPIFIQQWLKARNLGVAVEDVATVAGGAAETADEALSSLANYYTKTEVDAFGIPFLMSDGTPTTLPLTH